MHETRGDIAVGIALFPIDIDAVRVAGAKSRCQGTLIGLHAVVRTLVLQGISKVEGGPVAIEILGTDPAGRATDAPVGNLAVHLEAVGYPIGAANADPVIGLAIACGLNRLLTEN